jgi:maleylpyruvate isomerase
MPITDQAGDPRDVIPRGWLAGSTSGQRRVLDLLRTIDDSVARRPSLLPDWTVGHLATHLARGADGAVRVLAGGRDGVVTAFYPNGSAGRASDIEAGSGRPAAELLADAEAAFARFEQVAAELSPDAWRRGLGTGPYGPVTMPELVLRRWREVAIHTVDLGLADLGGPRWDDLEPAYLDAEWSFTTLGLAARVPTGHCLVLAPNDRPARSYGSGPAVTVIEEPIGVTLRYLTGRGGRPEWPSLGPWS